MLPVGQPFGPATPKTGGLGDPLPSPPREHALVHSTKHPPPVSSAWHESAPQAPHPTAPMAPGPSAPSKWQHPSPSWTVSPPQLEATPRVAPEGPPHSKRRDEMPLHKALAGGQQEAFARDSDLVWKAREEHYKTNHPHFNHKTSHDLTNIFQDMITSTGLLGFQIYEIQEFWEGQSELWYANNALRTLPKGLQFFHAVSPSESPTVMGLVSIHNPDALCHFSGMTFCLWSGKEGQNEGL